ncbi:coiled-coil domain-containing protein 138 [Sphaeramia orbicularis]|uniref:coiled-coil domain-containing protein 138 n=1 Tax=Sphaeramia orbicularis TaxID=375764 RepID=UPI00118035ED|nr:coiled-coil domain-containing protein 138 [Sphaeramia orbicularis]
MNQRSKNMDFADTDDNFKTKYSHMRKQPSYPEDKVPGSSNKAVHRLASAHRSKWSHKELKSYSKVLHELLEDISNIPERFDSDEDLSGVCAANALQDSQVLFTETDVTLPSCLNGSLGSQETETDRDMHRPRQLSDSRHSSSSVIAKVYQEMMTVYKQLRTERQSQQQWERQLWERERRLKQQEEALGSLVGLEDKLRSHILAVEEKCQDQVRQLQDLLRERNKENKRLKSSFDTIKNLNDHMKKQMNDIHEQNKKLESQSKRVQARLENLQRKYEHSVASRGCQKVSTECIKPPKKEKTSASGKSSNKALPASTKLLSLLLDWVLDGQTSSPAAGNDGKHIGHRLPPEILLNERCLQVLPLLADQLHGMPLSEPTLLLNLLRLIHWALRCLDKGTQHVALSATLRRIGEEVSKPSVQSAVNQCEDPDLTQSSRNWPLYRSPCPQTRILSSLIILHTVTQADVLAQVLDSLHTELMCEESRGLFIQYGGLHTLLSVLRAGRGGLKTPIDILMQLAGQSRYLKAFLEACSCEEFFQTASQLLKNPHLEHPSLEKLSILLQKLSSIRTNRRLFELSSLHLQIQELQHKSGHANTFLRLNLTSILHNLK